jgi:CRP-like cAMP-binding protein
VATLSDGAIFGEMSLITGQPRSATVVVTEDVDLIELGPEALAAMGDELSRVAPALDQLAYKRWMANLMRQSPIFQAFTDSERQELLKWFQALQVPRGTLLFDQGEQVKGIYLVVRGEVALMRRVRDGTPSLVAKQGPGSMPGMQALLAGTPTTTAATTLSPATVLFLPGSTFQRLMDGVPEFVQAIQGCVQSPPAAPREISHAC